MDDYDDIKEFDEELDDDLDNEDEDIDEEANDSEEELAEDGDQDETEDGTSDSGDDDENGSGFLFRQRKRRKRRQFNQRNEEFVPKLCHERNRFAGPPGCKRRFEAGSPPDSLRDERTRSLQRPSAQNRPVSSGTLLVNTIRTATVPSTKRWFGWRRISHTVIRWSTDTAISVRSTATAPPQCVTPKQDYRKSQPKCCGSQQNTVDFQDNYDGSEKEPVVLPSRIPNLLVNGATGIAVGMATNIPTHNLSEVIDGVLALIKIRYYG